MRHASRIASLLLVCCACVMRDGADAAEPRPTTRNVVLVTTDGLRWQEVFRGAEASLLNKKDGGVADLVGLRRDFWRETPEARREALMPFLWSTVARQGQILGNRDKKSLARVTNGRNFSYPGYNELFTGSPDPRIDSNDKRLNPNVTVFEWLNGKPAFHGKVAAVGSWDRYPFILNVERSGLPVNAGWMPLPGFSLSQGQTLLNLLMSRSVPDWIDCRNDVFTVQVALEQFHRTAPRVFYLGLGDTDEYAHAGRYDQYLRAAHQADSAIRSLWEGLQNHPQYRGTTTLIVTTDHGRGDPPQGWRSHGEKVEGSDAIWIAVLGPDTPALGERSELKTVTQSQVAATLAALLGEDFNADAPKAAPPIADVVKPGAGPIADAAPAPPLRRIAFGSCATQERPQPIWDAVAAAKPDLLLMLGDNIYADTENMNVMRAKYAKLAAMPGFQTLRASVPILATWDDHDLGVNDGGSDYPMKVESQKVFLDFFGDPEDSPRRKRAGVYDAKVFGPAGKQMQVIMLDTRYFRSSPLKKKTAPAKGEGPYEPNPDPSTTMLGEDQWRWLEEQLRQPAEIRLIASSIQVVAEDHGWEKWMNLPHERERLYRLIRETGAEGVVFLSGDRHLAELSMMDGGAGFPFYDVMSSGLNQAAKSWRPLEVNRHRVATMNWGDNFGLVTVNWDLPDPEIALQIRDVKGDVFLSQKIRLSTLRRPPPSRPK